MFTLNQEQKQIVSDTQGAKLVISGPGTGGNLHRQGCSGDAGTGARVDGTDARRLHHPQFCPQCYLRLSAPRL
jgi:hypothetical protein